MTDADGGGVVMPEPGDGGYYATKIEERRARAYALREEQQARLRAKRAKAEDDGE